MIASSHQSGAQGWVWQCPSMYSCNNKEVYSSEARKEKPENKKCTKKSMPSASFFVTAAHNKQGRTIGELGCDWAARGCCEFLQERFIFRRWPKAWTDCEGALTGPPLLDSAKRRSISERCVNLLGGGWFPNTPSTTACRYSTRQLLALHNLKGDFQVQTWILYFCLMHQTSETDTLELSTGRHPRCAAHTIFYLHTSYFSRLER